MISDRLKSAILKELRLDDFDIRDETEANELPGWDSLSHVRVLLAVETEFGIRFKGMEVLRLRNLGDLQAAVDKKLAGK